MTLLKLFQTPRRHPLSGFFKTLKCYRKFKDVLIKSGIGHEISKGVWYGSTLRKKARRDRDVDILVATKDGEAIRDRIADIQLEFQMDNRTALQLLK